MSRTSRLRLLIRSKLNKSMKCESKILHLFIWYSEAWKRILRSKALSESHIPSGSVTFDMHGTGVTAVFAGVGTFLPGPEAMPEAPEKLT